MTRRSRIPGSTIPNLSELRAHLDREFPAWARTYSDWIEAAEALGLFDVWEDHVLASAPQRRPRPETDELDFSEEAAYERLASSKYEDD